jgi:hypothetical protein
MINLQFRFINKSGAMVVSDPSVFEDTDNFLKFGKTRKGVWCAEFKFDNKMNLKSIKAVHEDSRIMLSAIEDYEVEVHSEQLGIFDAQDYRNDVSARDMPKEPYKIKNDGDRWYCAMSHITEISTYGPASYDHGALTETVNKKYKVFARKSIDNDYVQFEIKP